MNAHKNTQRVSVCVCFFRIMRSCVHFSEDTLINQPDLRVIDMRCAWLIDKDSWARHIGRQPMHRVVHVQVQQVVVWHRCRLESWELQFVNYNCIDSNLGIQFSHHFLLYSFLIVFRGSGFEILRLWFTYFEFCDISNVRDMKIEKKGGREN